MKEKMKKVLEQMEFIECIKNWTEEQWEYFKATKEAVEKQIPKPPKRKVVTNKKTKQVSGECPCCLGLVINLEQPKRCDDCGQALDWKD